MPRQIIEGSYLIDIRSTDARGKREIRSLVPPNFRYNGASLTFLV